MNIENMTVRNRLNKFAINIGDKVNRLSNVGTGLNSPSFYMSAGVTSTPMHIEDGGLDAVNLMLYADTDAVKLWLVIHSAYSSIID